MNHEPLVYQLHHISDEPLCMVQITDTHLFSSPDGKLLGVNTQDQLDQVLQKIKQHHAHAQLLLVTGDIAQEYDVEIYRRFFAQIKTLNMPFFCISGNHDDDEYAHHFSDHECYSTNKVIDLPHWYIVLLNSSLARTPDGRLSQNSLDWLQNVLTTYNDRPVVIALHHHPVPMNSTWIDSHMLANSDDFWHIVKQHTHVQAAVCGHVHQDYDAEHFGVRVLASPSTSVQFKPLSEDFMVDKKPAGYRWFRFFKSGRFETGVERLDKVPSTIDTDAIGY